MQDLLHPVARWAFDRDASQIHAVDLNGRVIMVIPSGPQFAARLVAAFCTPAAGQAAPSSPRPLGLPL